LAGARGHRRQTFGAALEQAEELARAASEASYATKPILLYYALAQGYRAACAAHLRTEWERSEHGLAVPGRGASVLETVVRAEPSRSDLYSGAAAIAREAPLRGEVTIGELWSVEFSLRDVPVPERTEARPLIIRIAHELDDQVAAGSGLFVTVDGLSVNSRDQLVELVSQFASLAGCEPAPFPTGSDEAELEGVTYRHVISVGRKLPVLRCGVEGTSRAEFQRRFEEIAPYQLGDVRDARAVTRHVGKPPQAIGPLTGWWALLLGLSSLARYHPARWRQALDVDRDPVAVGLERVLDIAQDVLPHYVLAGLDLQPSPVGSEVEESPRSET
jgi:hypothetical protein